LEHEHQHPSCPLKWDEEAVYKEFTISQRWTHQEVYEQVLSRVQQPAEGSTYDSKSIMHYPFAKNLITGPEEYKDGITYNSIISMHDITTVQMLYPSPDMYTQSQRVSAGILLQIKEYVRYMLGVPSESKATNVSTSPSSLLPNSSLQPLSDSPPPLDKSIELPVWQSLTRLEIGQDTSYVLKPNRSGPHFLHLFGAADILVIITAVTEAKSHQIVMQYLNDNSRANFSVLEQEKIVYLVNFRLISKSHGFTIVFAEDSQGSEGPTPGRPNVYVDYRNSVINY